LETVTVTRIFTTQTVIRPITMKNLIQLS